MELLDKIETIVKVAKELEKVATKLIKEIDAFIELITAEPEEKKPVVEAPKKVITLEQVRSYLTNLSRDGHTKEVKDLFDNKKEGLLILDEGEFPPLPPFKIGDVDDNGVVNTTDCTLILRYLKGYENLNDIQLLAADADKNEVVNT